MATGSNLINTSSNGQPTDNEDRPFSFAIGTQIFLNPSDSPTNGVVSFKADANLLAGTLASGTSNAVVTHAPASSAVQQALMQVSNWFPIINKHDHAKLR